tara:strand:- start:339 stop:1583 length:1245 start_codon:yes stop_codon:yes gene_type:complete
MDKNNKSYCRIPFDSVTVSPTGRMQLCCTAQWIDGSEKTRLKDIPSMQDWFKGEYISSVRTSMLKGEQVPECASCYKNEKLHGNSKRTYINEKYFKHNNDVSEHSIKMIDLKLGNTCNLKCKMCFPYASSELWKEWKDLGWNSKDKDPGKDTSWKYYDGYFEEDYSWPRDKTNMDKIKESAENSQIINVTGGEPTINPEFYELLDHVINAGKAKDMTIEFTTNATKIHPRLFEKLSKFKNLVLTISMDGIGKTYEYIRYPANFNAVYENIKKYSAFVKTLRDDSRLAFNFVLQVWNVHNAIDMIKKLAPLAVNSPENGVMIVALEDPTFMRWDMITKDMVKDTVKKIHSEMQKSHNKEIKWPIIAFAKIIGVYKEYRSSDRWRQLEEFTEKQDGHRGISIEEYIPELARFFRYL